MRSRSYVNRGVKRAKSLREGNSIPEYLYPLKRLCTRQK